MLRKLRRSGSPFSQPELTPTARFVPGLLNDESSISLFGNSNHCAVPHRNDPAGPGQGERVISVGGSGSRSIDPCTEESLEGKGRRGVQAPVMPPQLPAETADHQIFAIPCDGLRFAFTILVCRTCPRPSPVKKRTTSRIVGALPSRFDRYICQFR